MTRANYAYEALAITEETGQPLDMSGMPNRIREWRIERDLSLEDLATLVGCHQTYLGRIERGERRLTDQMIAKVAKALRVQPQDIMKSDGQVAAEQAAIQMAELIQQMTAEEREMTLELAKTVLSRRPSKAS